MILQILNLVKTRLKKIIKKLPPTNIEILNSLMGLLSMIAQCQQQTKMTATNLAICWAPNILRPKQEKLSNSLNGG